MKFSRKWVNEELVDLSHISDLEFVNTMKLLGHKVISYQTKDVLRSTEFHDDLHLDSDTNSSTHDTVIDFEISSKRRDCCSLIGLAREASAGFNTTMKCHEPIVQGNDGEYIYDLLDVDAPAEWLCNRYSARMVKNVKVAPSPKWLCDRLIASGVEPVNNIIDITNFVRIEYGQQVCAYDYRSISSGRLIIREADEGEMINSADGKLYHLHSGILVVSDDFDIIGIAGITGSAASGVKDDTTTIVFEAACFDDSSINHALMALGIETTEPTQFEYPQDSMLTVPALQRTCELIELLQCGDVLGGIIDVLNYIPEPRAIEFKVDQINGLLPTKLTRDEMIEYLKRLKIDIDDEYILIPSFRPDLSTLADIATEIQRIHKLTDLC